MNFPNYLPFPGHRSGSFHDRDKYQAAFAMRARMGLEAAEEEKEQETKETERQMGI